MIDRPFWRQRLDAAWKQARIVWLTGPRRVGKTVLAQGIGRGMGVTDPIKSSSFVIMNEYDGASLRLFHADLYRLEEPAQVAELALGELASSGVLVVEWPERALDELPPERLRLQLDYDGARGRVIVARAEGDRYEAIVRRLTR